MWAVFIEFAAPLIQKALCLEEACEPFTVELFISELVVEAFDPGLLPRRSRRSRSDVEGVDLFCFEPIL